MTFKSYLIDLLDREENVIINQLLDGHSPLCLDKYYLNSATTSTKREPVIATSNVEPEEPRNEAIRNYVMPLAQVINVNLVSWTSIDEFYLHLKEQQTSFSEFVKSCQVVPKIPIRQQVPRGSLVMTKYSTTGLYYRAEIYDYNEKLFKYKLVFVDIGIRAIVSADQLFKNPFLFTNVPKFSHKCCLVDREKVAGGLRDPEAMKRIGAIIQGARELTCTVKERLKDDLNVIQMTIDGTDLLETICTADLDGKETIVQVPAVNGERGIIGASNNDKTKLEMLKNQKLWIKPVDFLSKEVFRFSIKDMKGDLHKGAFDRGAVHLGIYTAVEVVRVANQM